MAKQRTPAKILELRGSFKKHPERKRTDPETNGDLGPPPDRLTDMQKLAWWEIVENHYEGVLCKAHRHIVEYLSIKLAHMWETGEADKEVRITIAALGMDPVNASKLVSPDKKKSGRFDLD